MVWLGKIILGAAATLILTAPAATAQSQQAIIARAIQRYVCERDVWLDSSYSRPEPRPHVRFRGRDGRFFAWSGDLSQSRILPEKPLRQVGETFDILVQGEQSLVLQANSHEIDRPDTPAAFLERAGGPGPAQSMRIGAPKDCPHFDAPTPWKARAIDAILKQIREEGKMLGWAGQPADLKVIIGNFNYDYSQVHVYVPALNKYLAIILRYDFNPGKKIADLNSIAMHVSPHDYEVDVMRPTIMKYGITRTIHWSGKL